jgi:hypothetical protein
MKNVMFAHVESLFFKMWAFLYFPVIYMQRVSIGYHENFIKKKIKKNKNAWCFTLGIA